jgi:hypothetical protein
MLTMNDLGDVAGMARRMGPCYGLSERVQPLQEHSSRVGSAVLEKWHDGLFGVKGADHLPPLMDTQMNLTGALQCELEKGPPQRSPFVRAHWRTDGLHRFL